MTVKVQAVGCNGTGGLEVLEHTEIVSYRQLSGRPADG